VSVHLIFHILLPITATMTDNIETSQSVDELIAITESCSCADNHLSLTPASSPSSPNDLSLLRKIISTRNFIAVVVKEILEKAWHLSQPIQVQRVDRNTFLFMFGHEVDRQLAFNRRPWTIKGAHLILQTWKPELSWQELVFSSSTFWIQIHGLPMLWQSKENITKIAQKIGRSLDADFTDD
jgi:hypothetical protein